ncbi:MAG: efflux RND transporter periplasmic adaptor subunit [Crocinitomicaceae bacterium]|nr:efflux RND transporter periplasmic adaptor subunit [Crocinitomicaceae bacterium]
MKRSQLVLLAVFLLISGLIYIVLAKNKKEEAETNKKEQKIIYVKVAKSKNTINSILMTSYGQVTPNTQLMMAFEIQGKLEQGKHKLKPGSNFSKGQVLARVDNREAFFTLSARKSALRTLILNILPDIELDFPSEKNKWASFLNEIKPSSTMPELPRMSSAKEEGFISSRNIKTEYYTLISLETRMEKYIYIAPFNGTVVEVYAESGSIINPGTQIAKIVKTGDFEVKVPISIEDLEIYKAKNNTTFTDASGKLVATGRITRISNVINQQTQSADVYYSVKAIKGEKIYNGMFLNVTIEGKVVKECASLPRTAIKDNKVFILKDKKLISIPITTISSKPDSVYVTGLKDGMNVVLEHVGDTENKVIYEGISRK